VDALVTPSERSVPGIPASVTPQEVAAEAELVKSADVVDRLARETGARPERLRQGLVVEPIAAGRNTTNLIAVRYTATDREEVSRVLARLPEVYVEKYLSVNRRPAVVEYFRSQAEQSEQELREAEEARAEFEKETPALAAEGNQAQARLKLTEVETQRTSTLAELRDAESRAVELERQIATLPVTIPQARDVAESEYASRLKVQLLDLENRLAQATRYREISQLEDRIAELKTTLASEARVRVEESVPNPARALLESAARRITVQLAGLRARRAALAEEERRRREQAAAGRLIAAENSVELAELTRRVKAAEENTLFYRKKYAEAREAELLDRSRVLNVSLSEGPRAPVRVEKRPLSFYLGLSWVLAMAVAAAGGFAAELLDHSVHTPRQLEDCSSLAVLACIPESRRG
jgi:uncharacterized protein involved in exopolysaccharide biosynthesis